MPTLPSEFDLGARPEPQPNTNVVPLRTGQEAKAVEGVGDAIGQISDHLAKVQGSIDLTKAIAGANEEIGAKEIQYQRDPDYATVPDRFRADAAAIGDKYAATIQNPLVRQSFQGRYAELAAQKQLSVLSTSVKQRADDAEAGLLDSLQRSGVARAQASISGNPAGVAVQDNLAHLSITALEHERWITHVKAEQMWQHYLRSGEESEIMQGLTSDPVGTLKRLQTDPTFGGHIDPPYRARLMHYAKQIADPVMVDTAAVDAITRVTSGGTAPLVTSSQPTPQVPPAPGSRGERLNNPGLIRKSGVPFEGKVEGADQQYESFATPEHGVAALSKNLLAYQEKHGLSTVQDIINRWAPPSENDTGSYVADVAARTGFAPNAKLNLRDPSTLQAVTSAIISHENGGNRYSGDLIATGASAALGTAALPPLAPSAPTTKLDLNAMRSQMYDDIDKQFPGDAVMQARGYNAVNSRLSKIIVAQEGIVKQASNTLTNEIYGLDEKGKPTNRPPPSSVGDLLSRGPQFQTAWATMDDPARRGIEHSIELANGGVGRQSKKFEVALAGRLHLDPSDPKYLPPKDALVNQYIGPGMLDIEGANAVRREMEFVRSGGPSMNRAVDKETANAIRTLNSDTVLAASDFTGEKRATAVAAFKADMIGKITAAREGGGDGRQFITPGNKDYLGTPQNIKSFAGSGEAEVAKEAEKRAAAESANLPVVNSDADYANVKPDTDYKGSDGTIRHKPAVAVAAASPVSAASEKFNQETRELETGKRANYSPETIAAMEAESAAKSAKRRAADEAYAEKERQLQLARSRDLARGR